MNKSIENAVLGLIAKEPTGNLLKAGEHIVKLLEWKPTHSRLEWDGSEKKNLPEYDDPTPQLAVMIGNTEGISFHRFNVFGFTQWPELTDDQQASEEYVKVIRNDKAYACKRNAKGKLVRIKSPKKTKDAESMLDNFMAVVGMTGKSVGELGLAVQGQTQFGAKIEDESYTSLQGELKTSTKITRWSSVGAEVESSGFSG